MISLLDKKIEFLKGVGPKKALILQKELGVTTFEDLLFCFPFRYVDKSKIHLASEINDDSVYYQLVGTVGNVRSHGVPRATRITADFTDESGSIELVWFKGLSWVKNRFIPGQRYVIFGKASSFNNKFNFVHPDIEDYNPDDFTIGESLQGVYNTSEVMKNNGLGTKKLAQLIKNILFLSSGMFKEVLPVSILKAHQLIAREEAIFQIHLPSSADKLQKAIERLKFEEYFFFQLHLLRNKLEHDKVVKSFPFTSVGHLFNDFFHHHLPFPLTNAQKRVIREIRIDLGSGRQMNRLLQGDVGSGKTIVALMVMLLALDNGFQAALMAPTEILANQHFASISDLLRNMPVKVALLTGSTRAKDRKVLHQALNDGSLQLLIGTHALIEDTVVFKQLGLVIIDEQHRFGVAQRARMYEKSDMPPHILVMTATPIPRTLAMTQYGDLDYSQIDEMPPGRKAVETIHLFHSQRLRMIGFLKKQIALGRQIYIVYPLIKESEKLDLINLMEGYDALLRDFPEPEYRICMVHGQMKAEDKDFEMQRFVKGQAHIMVATTVIEVGVNIPNASVMVIEHADRFGLSQLHQLRGRVGRGADQSYCILMTDFKLTADGRKRMQTMVSTSDGFKIAEVDLQLRGPGETQGTRQSGALEFKLGNLAKDEHLIRLVRKTVTELLENDNRLQQYENQCVRIQYEKLFKKQYDWSMIG
ncbi:MAG: ATP-dependent DNA helicase RecG [Bacteroidetes bacterium]|nr:MAG: ATP-dependent DNA helicase RecG [Bacteroidota bacterium]